MRDVEIRGLRTLEEDRIRNVIKTRGRRSFLFWRRSDVFRADFLQSDEQVIRAHAAQHGFLDAAVNGYTERDTASIWVDVIFEVVEGPRSTVRELGITGAGLIPDLRERLFTRLNEPFNPQNLTADRRLISDLYAERARFPRIETQSERLDSTRVTVKIDIVEGPLYRVGEVEIVGLTGVDTTVVRRELLLRSGAPFRSSDLTRSAERLYERRLFQFANFEPTRFDTLAAIVDVRVRLRESKHRWIEGGVGYSSQDGARVLGEWGHGNLGGKGREFAATGRVSFGHRSDFYGGMRYVEPWLFGTRTRGRAGVFIEQREEEFRGAPFTLRNWGIDLSASRKLNRWTEVALGFLPSWQIARNEPRLAEDEAVNDSLLVNFQKDQFFATRLTGSIRYDQRDDIFNPFRGQYHLANGEYAGQLLGGEGRYLKGLATATVYRPVRGRTSLAVRVQVGGINPIGAGDREPLETVPFSDLFRTGGSTSVRGYGENEINGATGSGGLMLVNTNVEARFPVWKIIGGAVFVDGGNVWSRPRDFKLKDVGLGREPIDGNQYRWSLGGGVRVNTPVGPFRFDLAYRLRDEAPVLAGQEVREAGLGYHVSIGQAY